MQPLYQALRKQPILSAYGIFCFFDIGLFWLTVSAGQEVMTTYTFFAQFLAAPALTAVLSFLAGRKPGKAAQRWALVLLFGVGTVTALSEVRFSWEAEVFTTVAYYVDEKTE